MTKTKKTRHPLKAWGAPDWTRKVSKTLTVSRVDEDIPMDQLRADRKPCYLALTQAPDQLARVGGVRGLPEGTTLLLSEDDVLALAQYLLEPQLALWVENPES